MEQAHHARVTPALGHRIKVRLEIAKHDVAMAVDQLEAGIGSQPSWLGHGHGERLGHGRALGAGAGSRIRPGGRQQAPPLA